MAVNKNTSLQKRGNCDRSRASGSVLQFRKRALQRSGRQAAELRGRRRLARTFPSIALLRRAACSTFPKTWSEFDDTLDRAPYVQQDLSQAWVGYPGTQLVLERRYRNVSEQRILLPNTTTLPGDNFVFMMTQGSNLTSLG
ncbi:MAG: hypothetical protein KJ755_19470, partial [Alphaproteobacteria bacterium]|nr:hypothetical protein [Alphaproteobacteria bacterium]